MMTGKLNMLLSKWRSKDEDINSDIYKEYFEYAKEISCSFSLDNKEQIEIVNRGFEKAFYYIRHFSATPKDIEFDFKKWIKIMMVYGAVDYFRYNLKPSNLAVLDPIAFSRCITKFEQGKFRDNLPVSHMENIIAQLSLSDKFILNLTIVQGLNEQQLAQCLQITFVKAQSIFQAAKKRLDGLLRCDVPRGHMIFDHKKDVTGLN